MDGSEADLFAPSQLGELLLATKFDVPQARSGTVSRRDVIERARASDCRVIGVTAPAGYGKSTLLAEWARIEQRRVGWVSLDRFDDDPAAFLVLLASAYAQFDPGCAYLVAEMRGVGPSLLGRAAPRLAAAFAAPSAPFVFFLDDLHETSPACHDVLEIVAARIPRGSQFVVSSRTEQAYLSRPRAAGDALELGIHDLALDAAGARRIFDAVDVPLSDALAAELTERTEGWAVGLYLAALIARDIGGDSLTVAGDDRYVADYLYRESLTNQPEEVKAFLRRTSILEQLSGPLCDAILESQDAADQLRRLAGHNLFLIPIDRRREWYRYHALFREFVLGELRRTEPGLITELHARAAQWYEAQQSPELALEHLLNTPERAGAAELAADLILTTYNEGRLSTVQRWLDTLGDEAIRAYPPLAVLAGWACVMTGDAVGAERWATFVESASFDSVPRDGTASFESARAMFRALMCASGPQAMYDDALFASGKEQLGSPWRDAALWELGEAHLLFGDIEQARARFAEASSCAAAIGNTDSLSVCESQLSLLAMDRGDWDEAREHLTVALSTIDANRMHDYVASLIAFAGAARLAVHDGDTEQARSRLAQAMRARPTATFAVPTLSVRVRVQLAKVYLALSEPKPARHLLREINDIVMHRPMLGRLLDEIDAVRARTADAVTDPMSASPLTPAELRLLPYLQTHLTFQQIGQRLFISRNTVASEVHAIYRKLGVSSRFEAVQHATAIGLLGG